MRYFLILLPLFLYSNSCLVCHSNKQQQCEKSNHYTLANSINITRKTWGIKDSNITLQTFPKKPKTIKEPKDLVDDFLQRKCLRCHLTSKSINPTKNSCLACHTKHTNKQDSYKAKPTQKKCLACHNGEFIGTDYLGMFPHDYDKSYRSPITKDGYYPNRDYGIDFHHLNSDIHYKKGLSCISCHKNSKKDGTNWESKVDCRSCHSNISKQNHKQYHNNLSCNSCHSIWSVSSYKLNILRDDTPNYKQWKRLTVQEDIELERFLNKALKSKKTIKPQMRNKLTNKLEDGVWYSGWLFRRWENFFLVNSDDGKIKVAKPMFQYHISFKDKNKTMVFDDISTINGEKIEAFLPKEPHTITKKGKSCQMCHNNQIMLNQNIINGDILKGKILKGSPLTKTQLNKLQSEFYKKERAKLLFNN